MKIISQTTDEMTLTDSSVGTRILGVIFILAGFGAEFFRFGDVGALSSPSAPAIVLWVGIGLFIVGLCILLFSASIFITINKASGQISYQQKEMVGTKNAAYAIADVLRVETRKTWRTETTGDANNRQTRQVLVSQSVIVFKSGAELAIDHQNSGSTAVSIGPATLRPGAGKEVALATQVATFMGVPFQEIAPPSMGGLGTGINVGGIQL